MLKVDSLLILIENGEGVGRPYVIAYERNNLAKFSDIARKRARMSALEHFHPGSFE